MNIIVKWATRQIYEFIDFFRPLFTSAIITLSLLFLLTFIGCTGKPDRSVEMFVQSTKAQKPQNIGAIPSFTKIKPYQYTAHHLRSPFEDQSLNQAEKPKITAKRPDAGRTRELLESFPLDTLKFVGTIQRAANYWALIRDANGFVHHVRVGNYMGENFGKIVKIEEKLLVLKEMVPDGNGGYRERTVELKLTK